MVKVLLILIRRNFALKCQPKDAACLPFEIFNLQLHQRGSNAWRGKCLTAVMFSYEHQTHVSCAAVILLDVASRVTNN